MLPLSGRLTPLLSRRTPPHSTRHCISRALKLVTMSSICPSFDQHPVAGFDMPGKIRVRNRHPFRCRSGRRQTANTAAFAPAGVCRSPVCRCESHAPRVSTMIASVVCSASAARRMRPSVAACDSMSPWDMFSRATFMPAEIISRSVWSESHAGPMVAMTLVFLNFSFAFSVQIPVDLGSPGL